MQRKIPYILIFLIIFVILGEIFFLFFTKNNASLNPQNTSTIIHPQSANDATNLPAGFYIVNGDNIFYMFVGNLNNITKNNNGDVLADISFNLNKGVGTPTNKQFLLYTKGKFTSKIILQKTKSFSFTIATKDQKVILLDPAKNQNEAVNALQRYTGKKAIFIFERQVFPTVIQKAVKDSGNILNQLISCNQSFLDALENNENLPSCIPYAYSIVVYDKNI